MKGERLDELDIPLMVSKNVSAKKHTAFTVSVDYNKGTTTGISAYDRAATVKAMIDPNTKPEEMSRPGHLFPLRYNSGRRAGPARTYRGYRRLVRDGGDVPLRHRV